jgi:hypothetical protein
MHNPVIRYVVTTETRYNPVNTNYRAMIQKLLQKQYFKGCEFQFLIFNHYFNVPVIS